MQRLPAYFLTVVLAVALVSPASAKIFFTGLDEIAVELNPEPGPQVMALVDMNDDQTLDLVVAETGYDTILVFLNDGKGNFEEDESADTESEPVAVVAIDVNRDRRVDLISANRGSNSITVAIQNVDGAFDDPQNFSVDMSPVGLVPVNLDNDGRVDLAVLGDSSIYLLKGVGNGTFNPFPTASISTGSGTRGNYAIAAGNFNGDSSTDLVVSSRGGSRVSVLLGNGDGTFQAARPIAVSLPPGNLVVGDFGGNPAYDDVAVVTADPDRLEAQVTLLISDGSGGFDLESTGSETIASISESAIGMAGGDFDGDGKMDLVVTNTGGGLGAEILCRQPSAGDLCYEPGVNGLVPAILPDDNGFQLQFQQPPGGAATSVVAGDINNDRRADILTASAEGDLIRVILNTGASRPGSPTPTATLESSTSVPTVFVTPTPTPTITLTYTPRPTATPTLIPTLPYTVCSTNQSGLLSGRFVSVATADFDRDGAIEIAGADAAANRIVILHTNLKAGHSACEILGLEVKAQIDNILNPTSLVAADLDGDGRADLAVVGSSGLSVFYGDGRGNFQAGPENPIPIGSNGAALSVADVNRDGAPDLFIATPGSSANEVIVLVNDTSNRRAYRPACRIPVGRPSDALIVQDLNRDGLVDFAIATRQTSTFSVFEQLGAGATPSATTCPAGTNGFRDLPAFELSGEPRAMVAAVLEPGDSVPDLGIALRSTAPGTDGRLAVIRGAPGSGGIVAYELSANLVIPHIADRLPSLPSSIASADLNRDGKPDLVVTDEANDTVVAFLGQAGGSFGPSLIPAPLGGAGPAQLLLSDVDRDGIPDIVVANAGRGPDAGGISILVSSRPPNTPTPLATSTPTLSGTPTASPTDTPSVTPTETPTASVTLTPSRTPTQTAVPSAVPTKTLKPGTLSLSSCAIGDTNPEGGMALLLLPMAAVALRWKRGRRK